MTVALEEVRSRSRLRDFLRDCPQEIRAWAPVFSAQKSALRVFPIAAKKFFHSPDEVTQVSIFGAIAASCIASELIPANRSKDLSLFNERLATASRIAGKLLPNILRENSESSAAAAIRAIHGCAEATAFVGHARISSAAAAAAAADYASSTDIWLELQNDLSEFRCRGLTWTDQRGRAQFEMSWRTVRDHLLNEESCSWEFWIFLLQRVFSGNDWYPDRVLSIMERLTRSDWKQGPGHINPMFDEVLALYQAEDDDAEATPLSKAYPVDFTFDALRRVMRMVGIDDNLRHLREPEVVQAFVDDTDELKDGFQDFIDYAGDLAGAGNQAGVLRRASTKLLDELRRADEAVHIRAGRIVQLADDLEAFSRQEVARADLGPVLSQRLDDRIDTLKDVCRRHFGPSYLTLAPLAGLNFDQIDQETVLAGFDAAIGAVARLPTDDLVALDPEGLAILRDMLDELRSYRAAIAEASTDEFREMLESRFAQRSGAAGLTLTRLYDKSATALGTASTKADIAIRTHKRFNGLKDIWDAVRDVWPGDAP